MNTIQERVQIQTSHYQKKFCSIRPSLKSYGFSISLFHEGLVYIWNMIILVNCDSSIWFYGHCCIYTYVCTIKRDFKTDTHAMRILLSDITCTKFHVYVDTKWPCGFIWSRVKHKKIMHTNFSRDVLSWSLFDTCRTLNKWML